MDKEICLPDYRGMSIVNLMSSIGGAFGLKSHYMELNEFNSNEIKKYKNVVLIIIDGLGYEYLKERDRKRVYDFHPDNSKNIEGYAKLIESLVEKYIIKK